MGYGALFYSSEVSFGQIRFAGSSFDFENYERGAGRLDDEFWLKMPASFYKKRFRTSYLKAIELVKKGRREILEFAM